MKKSSPVTQCYRGAFLTNVLSGLLGILLPTNVIRKNILKVFVLNLNVSVLENLLGNPLQGGLVIHLFVNNLVA